MSLDGLPLICICVLAGFLSYCCEHGVPQYVMIIDRDEDELASLVSVVEGYSIDIGMEFGMEKCAVLTIEGGKRVKSEGMELPSGEVMNEVDENGYKYFLCVAEVVGEVEVECGEFGSLIVSIMC